MDRFLWHAVRAVLVAAAAVAFVLLVAGAVRILPWLLDPSVPWRVATPFARGLAALAIEAAIVVGWPVGWALACFRLVESGEARVLQTLGERPGATLGRLAPQGLGLAVALSLVSLAYGTDAGAPGRVATELVSRGRIACERATGPTTYAIPFTDMTWLCAPGRAPRLVGSPPGIFSSARLTAASARFTADFRAIDLDDVRIVLPGPTPISVHVATASLRGMAPWAHASTLPPFVRALLLALAAGAAAALSVGAVLRSVARSRAGVLVLSVVGPVAALGCMRLLERYDASRPSFALVPIASAGSVLLAAALLSRLRRRTPAATM